MNNQKTNDVVPPTNSSPKQSVPKTLPTNKTDNSNSSSISSPIFPSKKLNKKKLGRAIALCLLGVLLIGGGIFALVYLNWRQSDKVVLADAVTGVIKQSEIAITGSVEAEFNEDSQSEIGLKALRISLESTSSGADSRGEGVLVFVSTEGEEINVSIGGAFMSDGIIYIKVDGTADALESLRSELPEEFIAIAEYLKEFLQDLDGQWYRIAISDLGLGEEAEAAYSCLIDATKFAATDDSRGEIAKLYQDHPFLDATRLADSDADGNSVFSVAWDAARLADFSNGLRTTETYQKSTSCSDTNNNTPNTTPADVAMPEDFPKINLHISPWAHELKGISINYAQDGNTLKADLKFNYNDVKVTVPENAKPISEVLTSLESVLKKAAVSMVQPQIVAICASYSTLDQADCIATYTEQINEYIDDMDLNELLIDTITGAL